MPKGGVSSRNENSVGQPQNLPNQQRNSGSGDISQTCAEHANQLDKQHDNIVNTSRSSSWADQIEQEEGEILQARQKNVSNERGSSSLRGDSSDFVLQTVSEIPTFNNARSPTNDKDLPANDSEVNAVREKVNTNAQINSAVQTQKASDNEDILGQSMAASLEQPSHKLRSRGHTQGN